MGSATTLGDFIFLVHERVYWAYNVEFFPMCTTATILARAREKDRKHVLQCVTQQLIPTWLYLTHNTLHYKTAKHNCYLQTTTTKYNSLSPHKREGSSSATLYPPRAKVNGTIPCNHTRAKEHTHSESDTHTHNITKCYKQPAKIWNCLRDLQLQDTKYRKQAENTENLQNTLTVTCNKQLYNSLSPHKREGSSSDTLYPPRAKVNSTIPFNHTRVKEHTHAHRKWHTHTQHHQML